MTDSVRDGLNNLCTHYDFLFCGLTCGFKNRPHTYCIKNVILCMAVLMGEFMNHCCKGYSNIFKG